MRMHFHCSSYRVGTQVVEAGNYVGTVFCYAHVREHALEKIGLIWLGRNTTAIGWLTVIFNFWVGGLRRFDIGFGTDILLPQRLYTIYCHLPQYPCQLLPPRCALFLSITPHHPVCPRQLAVGNRDGLTIIAKRDSAIECSRNQMLGNAWQHRNLVSLVSAHLVICAPQSVYTY